MTPPRFKYPRTFHLPYSQRKGQDDKVLPSDEIFSGRRVVVTEKMDGENTTLYPDFLHARSIDSEWDESKRWLDRLRALTAYQLPAGWRLCGENLFYRHTIHYTELDTFFLVYSVWNEQNTCLSWSETREWCGLLGLKTIPVLYEGEYDSAAIMQTYEAYTARSVNPVEGFVVRRAESFGYEEFSRSAAKFVSDSFRITTSKHWKYEVKELNQLKGGRNVWELYS